MIFNIRGKVKNNKKCNKELVAHGEVTEGHDDARISLEEILNSQRPEHFIRECIQHTAQHARLLQSLHVMIPHILTPQQKRDRVAYSSALLTMYKNCDPRHLDELVTSGHW